MLVTIEQRDGPHGMIQANCRAQLTADDFQFLVEVLARKSGDRVSLESLLHDESSLNQILDHDAVFDALLSRRDCLPISPHLYFYVIARRILRNAGIEDRAVADYLAEMLVEFSDATRVHGLPTRPGQSFEYISDLLSVISESRREETFVVRAHIGNYTLFLTGIFPRRVEHRTRYKGAPDMTFYEGIGSANFRILSGDHIAHRTQLHDVFHCLGGQFRSIRLAMNQMADRFLHLDAGDSFVDKGLRLLTGGNS